MLPSPNKLGFLDTLQEIINSVLFPAHKGKSESFSKWNGPHWRSVREEKSWMESRRNLEGAEGLWRIDDKIYDLHDFVEKHPGGREWIEITQGTDITELFKSHHISNVPREMLSKFYVRNAKTPRNSPFTFEQNGFYEVLRRRISEEAGNMARGPSMKSKAFADLLFTLTIFMSVAATRTGNYFLAFTAGVLLACTTICAHNFFHQRDHWRRYYFQLSGLSVKSWRVSHAMSHHMFPNSQHDLEVAMFEPWLQWLPKEKNLLSRYVSWVISPVVYVLLFPIASLIRWGITGHDGVPELLPLVVPAAMMLGSSTGAFLSVMYWWVIILLTASFTFGLVGLNAGHHHPELFHDGDIVKSNEKMDWGIYQMLAVRDRIEVRESIFGLISFGDHCIHHLFPTLDHAHLHLLYPTLRKTCQDFEMDLATCSIWQAIRGQFIQLARVQRLDFTSKYQ